MIKADRSKNLNNDSRNNSIINIKGSIKTNKRRFLCCFGGRYTTKSNEFAIDEKDKSFDCNETGETDLICRNGSSFNEYLLPPQCPLLSGRNSLVIDLDETLVHSSFKPFPFADFVISVETDGESQTIFVAKRPFVDLFLERMHALFECILFTASLQQYADLVANKLSNHFHLRLFREACLCRNGIYIKNLSILGRSLSKLAIIDNSPACYSLHPHNAIPVNSWFDDPNDTELLDILPYMEKIAIANDIRIIISCEM
ncbi:hypothetical protein GJ496_004770 [Pomphorhynchus laevis]|nr:hypothetical protein GJ496_004770 [Pomphorhynchus laevis]